MVLCVVACRRIVLESLNDFGQSVHLKGRRSLCLAWCNCSVPLVAHVLPHSSQTNGRWPICTLRTCNWTFSALLNALSHSGHGWIIFSASGRWPVAWRSNFGWEAKCFGHLAQPNVKTSGVCLFRMCVMYRRGISNILSQRWHHTSVLPIDLRLLMRLGFDSIVILLLMTVSAKGFAFVPFLRLFVFRSWVFAVMIVWSGVSGAPLSSLSCSIVKLSCSSKSTRKLVLISKILRILKCLVYHNLEATLLLFYLFHN